MRKSFSSPCVPVVSCSEIGLAKLEGELDARDEELAARARDLAAFRAMLVDQEAAVKALTSSVKEQCKTIADSAQLSRECDYDVGFDGGIGFTCNRSRIVLYPA